MVGRAAQPTILREKRSVRRRGTATPATSVHNVMSFTHTLFSRVTVIGAVAGWDQDRGLPDRPPPRAIAMSPRSRFSVESRQVHDTDRTIP